MAHIMHKVSTELLYLSREAVAGLLPPVEQQLELVERTLQATSTGRVELPPKLGVYPRADSLVHAMPAYLAEDDVVAVKWISAYSGNSPLGLPSISGVIVLNEAETGRPIAVMDAAEITAVRTAAVSGVCIRRFAPDGWRRVGIVGFGEQGRFHARMVAGLNAEASVAVYSPRGRNGYEEPVEEARSAAEAIAGADIVVTAAPLARQASPAVVAEALAGNCLVLPIDFGASVASEAVECADLFLVDDDGQFEVYRQKGFFDGWPDPHGVLADLGVSRPARGRVVCCNLGVGSLDAAFAAAVLAEARTQEIGLRLPR
jgi:ornithine cyclodeaminase/alanine dehydrogenase-like protein (mu-crystallin family)